VLLVSAAGYCQSSTEGLSLLKGELLCCLFQLLAIVSEEVKGLSLLFCLFQLLLDTHSLKTVLLDLPSLGSSISRKAPARL